MSTPTSRLQDAAYEREWEHRECLNCGELNKYCECENEEVDD